MHEGPRFTETAIRIFSRLPDELVVRAPELARRVAAQVGAENPTVLQRVIRLVGFGSLSAEAAAGLEDILDEWAKSDPSINSFVPTDHAARLTLKTVDPRGLARTAQYLLGSRIPDTATVERLAAWLRWFAAPRRG